MSKDKPGERLTGTVEALLPGDTLGVVGPGGFYFVSMDQVTDAGDVNPNDGYEWARSFDKR